MRGTACDNSGSMMASGFEFPSRTRKVQEGSATSAPMFSSHSGGSTSEVPKLHNMNSLLFISANIERNDVRIISRAHDVTFTDCQFQPDVHFKNSPLMFHCLKGFVRIVSFLTD